jgi:hypothetical protein
LTAPHWYRALLRSFGETLRAPLHNSGAHFVARLPAGAPIVAFVVDDGPGAVARLALYQEQYWMRLFGVFQETFPRTAQALTPFVFNTFVSAFRAEAPSSSCDLAEVVAGFSAFVLDAADARVTSLVRDAVAVDEAERQAWRAPAPEPPALAEPMTTTLRVRLAAGAGLVRVQHDVRISPGTGRLLAVPSLLLVSRSGSGVVIVEVDRVFARVIATIGADPAGAVLGDVERAIAARLPAEALHAWPALYARMITQAARWGALCEAPLPDADPVCGQR